MDQIRMPKRKPLHESHWKMLYHINVSLVLSGGRNEWIYLQYNVGMNSNDADIKCMWTRPWVLIRYCISYCHVHKDVRLREKYIIFWGYHDLFIKWIQIKYFWSTCEKTSLCLVVFKPTFNNISAISWRSALLEEEIGKPRENPDLSQFTDKRYHIMWYTSSWSRFELTTLVGVYSQR